MNKYTKVVLTLVVAAFLTACGGIGNKGSIAWNATASDQEKRKYYTGVCLREGFKLDTREMEACILSEPRERVEYRGGGYVAPTTGYQAPDYKVPVITPPPIENPAYCSGGRVMTAYGCSYR